MFLGVGSKIVVIPVRKSRFGPKRIADWDFLCSIGVIDRAAMPSSIDPFLNFENLIPMLGWVYKWVYDALEFFNVVAVGIDAIENTFDWNSLEEVVFLWFVFIYCFCIFCHCLLSF